MPPKPVLNDCGESAAKLDEFRFPDGGWECSKCQNYNFKGRKTCNRCKKAKGSDDVEGKPTHMNEKKRNRRMRRQKQFK